MHLFLVNDDGIGCKGIMALLRAATARGHRVTMCAPAHQQSAASQRITLIEPIYVAPYPVDDPLVTAYAITGTPTDCVRLGLQNLVTEPVDLLLSGINNGYNYGMAVHYSGTIGAAREGTLHGVPSVACSIDDKASMALIDSFASFVLETAQCFVNLPIAKQVLLNINAPNSASDQWKKPVMVPLCTANFVDTYIRRESPRAGTYYWLEGGAKTRPATPGSDQEFLREGHITFTFLGNPSEEWPAVQGFAETCQTLGEWL